MKAIVSVMGVDKKGIIAKVSGKMFESNVNIEDISQTIMDNNFFVMVMMVNLDGANKTILQLSDELQIIAKEVSMEIRIQAQDVFEAIR